MAILVKVPAVFTGPTGKEYRFEVEVYEREDGTFGPPLEIYMGDRYVLDGFSDGVAGYRLK